MGTGKEPTTSIYKIIVELNTNSKTIRIVRQDDLNLKSNPMTLR